MTSPLRDQIEAVVRAKVGGGHGYGAATDALLPLFAAEREAGRAEVREAVEVVLDDWKSAIQRDWVGGFVIAEAQLRAALEAVSE